jgi:hypothetical protein
MTVPTHFVAERGEQPPPPAPPRRLPGLRTLRAVARFLSVPALVLAGVFGLMQWPAAAGVWQRLDPMGSWLPWAAAAGLCASHGLRALRIHAEWQPRCGAGRLDCLRVSLLHSAAVNLLPMRSGELGFPVLMWRRWRVPVVDSTSSLVCMRVQDMVVLAWLAALSALAWWSGQGAQFDPWPALPAAAVTLLFLYLVSRTAVWRCSASRPGLAATWLVLPRTPGARRLRALVSAVQKAVVAASPASWAWSVGNWVLKLGTLAALLTMLTGERALAAWIGVLAGEGAAALPVQAPAGFGSYEAAAALGARAAGAQGFETLLAAALTVHLFTLVVTLAGAAWAAFGGRVGPARVVPPSRARH